MHLSSRVLLRVAQVLIGVEIFLNLQAALVFILNPAAYASGFEVSGIPGQKLVQGMGILFIMWNVPYIFALVQPVKNRISLISAMIMQLVGVLGESLLLVTLPNGHSSLSSTALRFIIFDSAGLIALVIAWLITRKIPLQGNNQGIKSISSKS